MLIHIMAVIFYEKFTFPSRDFQILTSFTIKNLAEMYKVILLFFLKDTPRPFMMFLLAKGEFTVSQI